MRVAGVQGELTAMESFFLKKKKKPLLKQTLIQILFIFFLLKIKIKDP